MGNCRLANLADDRSFVVTMRGRIVPDAYVAAFRASAIITHHQ